MPIDTTNKSTMNWFGKPKKKVSNDPSLLGPMVKRAAGVRDDGSGWGGVSQVLGNAGQDLMTSAKAVGGGINKASQFLWGGAPEKPRTDAPLHFPSGSVAQSEFKPQGFAQTGAQVAAALTPVQPTQPEPTPERLPTPAWASPLSFSSRPTMPAPVSIAPIPRYKGESAQPQQEPLDAFLSRMGGNINTGVQNTQPQAPARMDALELRKLAGGGAPHIGGQAGAQFDRMLGFGNLDSMIRQGSADDAMAKQLALRRADDESMDSQMRRMVEGEGIGAQRLQERGELQKQWEEPQRFSQEQSAASEAAYEQLLRFAQQQATGEETLKEQPLEAAAMLAERLSKLTGLPREQAMQMLHELPNLKFTLPPTQYDAILRQIMGVIAPGAPQGSAEPTQPTEQGAQPQGEKAGFARSFAHGAGAGLAGGAGAAGGAALGRYIGGLGGATLGPAGAVAGGIGGGLLGSWLGGKAGEAIDPTYTQTQPNALAAGLGGIAGGVGGYKGAKAAMPGKPLTTPATPTSVPATPNLGGQPPNIPFTTMAEPAAQAITSAANDPQIQKALTGFGAAGQAATPRAPLPGSLTEQSGGVWPPQAPPQQPPPDDAVRRLIKHYIEELAQ